MDKKPRSRRKKYALIPTALLHSTTLSGAAKLIYDVLASEINDDSRCVSVSYDYISKSTDYCHRHISKAIKELVGSGWIIKTERHRASPIYELNYEPTTGKQ